MPTDVDSDAPEPRPWILLVIAAVLVLIGLTNLGDLNDPDSRELAVGGLGLGGLLRGALLLG